MSINDTLTALANEHYDVLERALEHYCEDRVDELVLRGEGPVRLDDGRRHGFIVAECLVSGAHAAATYRIPIDDEIELNMEDAVFGIFIRLRDQITREFTRSHFWRPVEDYQED